MIAFREFSRHPRVNFRSWKSGRMISDRSKWPRMKLAYLLQLHTINHCKAIVVHKKQSRSYFMTRAAKAADASMCSTWICRGFQSDWYQSEYAVGQPASSVKPLAACKIFLSCLRPGIRRCLRSFAVDCNFFKGRGALQICFLRLEWLFKTCLAIIVAILSRVECPNYSATMFEHLL